jgi:hypothetical protein
MSRLTLHGVTYDGTHGERIVSVEDRNGTPIEAGDYVRHYREGSTYKVKGFSQTPFDRVRLEGNFSCAAEHLIKVNHL